MNSPSNALPFTLLGMVIAVTCVGGALCLALLTRDVPPLPAPPVQPSDFLLQFSSEEQQANALFGHSVAMSRDHLLIGCPTYDKVPHDNRPSRDTGAAYLIHRNQLRGWNVPIPLVARSVKSADLFGYSVALSEQRALVGVCPVGHLLQAGEPTAYVFEPDAEQSWRQTTSLVLADASERELFHVTVALAGRVAAVGQIARVAGCDQVGGNVYVFAADDAGNWRQTAQLADPRADSCPVSNFGDSVSIAGERLVVGAPHHTTAAQHAGTAYIYQQDTAGAWRQAAELCSDQPNAGDLFGSSVAICGQTALVGAPAANCAKNARYSPGAAYLFREQAAGVWKLIARLTADDAADWHCFGSSVALTNQFAAVGAPGANDGAGAVYLFRFSANGAPESVENITHAASAPRDRFSHALALSDDGLLIGAPDDDFAAVNAGAAYWKRLPAATSSAASQ